MLVKPKEHKLKQALGKQRQLFRGRGARLTYIHHRYEPLRALTVWVMRRRVLVFMPHAIDAQLQLSIGHANVCIRIGAVQHLRHRAVLSSASTLSCECLLLFR